MDDEQAEEYQKIDAGIIAALTKHLDKLVGACMDQNGKPKAPSYQDLMRARGALPSTAKHALTKKA